MYIYRKRILKGSSQLGLICPDRPAILISYSDYALVICPAWAPRVLPGTQLTKGHTVVALVTHGLASQRGQSLWTRAWPRRHPTSTWYAVATAHHRISPFIWPCVHSIFKGLSSTCCKPGFPNVRHRSLSQTDKVPILLELKLQHKHYRMVQSRGWLIFL